MTVEELAKGVTSGKRRALAKAITLIESNREVDHQKGIELLELLQEDRDTIRVGISGVPGVGKSTFIESLGNVLIERGHKVAVLAVDPSSPTSGGSILGDKTRMETLSSREEAFIRPSPTSGTLGGVAQKTRESMMLCEAAGYDIILIETVGVGQSEFEVASMVDCFMVLMLPGAGDSLQGIKRGILEITDILVVNKADGEQKNLAERAVAEYKHAFQLLHPKYDGIQVECLTASALKEKTVEDVWDKVWVFISKLKEKGILKTLRQDQNLKWFRRLAEHETLRDLWHAPANKQKAAELEEKIQKNEITPSAAAQKMIKG
jgi:LAO/AO transport system kinase